MSKVKHETWQAVNRSDAAKCPLAILHDVHSRRRRINVGIGALLLVTLFLHALGWVRRLPGLLFAHQALPVILDKVHNRWLLLRGILLHSRLGNGLVGLVRFLLLLRRRRLEPGKYFQDSTWHAITTHRAERTGLRSCLLGILMSGSRS